MSDELLKALEPFVRVAKKCRTSIENDPSRFMLFSGELVSRESVTGHDMLKAIEVYDKERRKENEPAN